MYKEIIWLTVGEIVAPHGLRGEVRVNPSSDFPERFLESGQRWLQEKDEAPQKIELVSGRQIPGKSIYVVSFLGIDNRTSAELLVGKKVLVNSNQRPKLEEGEFHLLDLLGLKVKLQPEEREIGKIINLINAGNDLLEIELNSGKKVLVPFVTQIVPTINLKEGWAIISPPPGLFNL